MGDGGMIEVWRPVPGYEGLYEVSDLGKVRRLDREQHVTRYGKATTCIRKGGHVASHPNGRGYMRVTLFRYGEQRDHFVHRLVCLAFLGPPPTDRHQAAHSDGTTDNNRLTNLSWKTPSENAADALAHGRYLRGERAHHAKLTGDKVREMRRLYATGGFRFQDLADRFNVSHRAAYMAAKGITWKHIGE
jgi:hypothetical protein